MSNTIIPTSNSVNRDFKGIWIPREIWLHPMLSTQAKVLWSEIWSLHDRESGGCFATNEYLCDFMKVKLSRLKEIMKELRDFGLLVDVFFNGRSRIIRAEMPEVEYGGQQMAGIPAGRQPEKRPADSRDSAPLSDYIYTIRDTILDNTPPNPQKSKPKKTTSSSGEGGSLKSLKKHGDYVELSEEDYQKLKATNPNIDTIIEEMNDWIAARGKNPYKSFYHALKQWIRKRETEIVKPSKNKSFTLCSDEKKSLEIAKKLRENAI